RRVGAIEARPVDVRFVSATQRDLLADAGEGRFRTDLYFRLNGVSLTVPPLRDRRDEIEPLARAFMAQACRDIGPAVSPALSPEALVRLHRHPWPGNVRELRSVVERAVLLSTGREIRAEDLPIDGGYDPGRSDVAPRETSDRPPPSSGGRDDDD